MAANWLKYKNNDNATIIFDLDRATHYRHIADGASSFLEVFADGTMHSILRLTDPVAYDAAMNHVKDTTGFTIE